MALPAVTLVSSDRHCRKKALGGGVGEESASDDRDEGETERRSPDLFSTEAPQGVLMHLKCLTNGKQLHRSHHSNDVTLNWWSHRIHFNSIMTLQPKFTPDAVYNDRIVFPKTSFVTYQLRNSQVSP